MTEEWRTVKEFPNYAVSNEGRVRNDETGKVLKPAHCGQGRGYTTVQLWKNKKGASRLVHRLVGFAFVDGCKDGLQINHIDGVKSNSNASNLEWVTGSENLHHAYDTGLSPSGENHVSSKLTNYEVLEIRALRRMGTTLQVLADFFGVSLTLVSLIVNNKTRRRG